MVAHAKSFVKNRLLAAQDVDLAKLARQAKNRHGEEAGADVIHSSCLGAMLAKRHDLARGWLKDQIKAVPEDSAHKGKALWALARMETDLGNHAEAARHYFAVANLAATPTRFRIHAILKAFRESGKGGEQLPPDELKPLVIALLDTTSDFRVLLDAGRQLGFAGSAFHELKVMVRERGKALADQEFIAATSPAQALLILDFLSRRLYYDLGDSSGVIERWKALAPNQRRLFQTTASSTYFEYVAVVLSSFASKNMVEEVKQLASLIIDKNTATPEGYVIVGTEYALWLISRNEISEAREHLKWIALECPSHRRAAHSHYWLALWARKTNKNEEALKSAKKIRACFAGNPTLLSEWELDARSIIIQDLFFQIQVIHKYNEEFINLQHEVVKKHLALV
jgi:tetratricopeptide (TPR) repeat protein